MSFFGTIIIENFAIIKRFDIEKGVKFLKISRKFKNKRKRNFLHNRKPRCAEFFGCVAEKPKVGKYDGRCRNALSDRAEKI